MRAATKAAFRLMAVMGVTAAKLIRFRVGGMLLSEVERRRYALNLLGEWGRALTGKLRLRVETFGEPASLPALWVGNHRSYLDIPVLESLRPCVFLAKQEISRWPLFGSAARAGGMVFVRRGEAADRRRALTEIGERIAAGSSLVVFAEGTTSTGPGILPFKPGAFRLAYESGVRVSTFAIAYEDAELAWVGDDTFVGHFVRMFGSSRVRAVRVAFGPTLDPRRYSSADALCAAAHDQVLELTQQLERSAWQTASA